MAYEYDQLGNVIGEYESDEERRRRLDAEAAQQPVKQTTTYNPDGTQEMTIRGTPQALSAANPNTPTLTNPVAPPSDDVFRRMQQAESGGRDYNAQGQPLTSSAGAMYRNQVMPSTAAQPGYGVRPAQSQTPEEYNRVGQEYYQAMLKKFGGNTQAAAAAYNAGPGRVQQNMQANQGQMNPQQLPRETQGYLQKIGQMASNMIPSAQASTLPPVAPVAPSTFQGQTNEFGGMESPPAPSSYVMGTQMGNQGIRIPGLTPVNQMPAPVDSTTQAITRYQQIQDNPQELMKLGYSDDPAVPEFLRNRARTRTAELITQQREMAMAKEQIPNMSESEIAAALRKKTTGGDYFKAVLFGILGMENSAMAEAAKLGIGRETFTMVNGQPAIVKIATNGTPIEGYNAVTGKKLSAEELVAAAQSATVMKGANIGGQVYRDPVTNETLTKVDTQQGPIYYNKSQQRVVPKGEPIPLTAGSDIATQLQLAQMKRQQQFVGQTATARLSAYEETNKERAFAGFAPLTPEQMGINRNGELIGQPQPQTPQLQQPPGMAGQGQQPATQQQAQQQPMPQGPGNPAQVQQQPSGQPGTGAQLKAQREGQQTVITEAAKQVAASADTQNMLKDINKITGLLDSGEHNIGSALSGFVGRGPVAQAIGAQFETVDAKNTKTILDTVNKLAADGLKALGSNPSTPDLLFWTKYKPDGSSDPAFVRDWIQSRSDDLKRRLGYAGAQMNAGGSAGVAPAAGSGVPGTAGNPIKLK